MAAIGVHLVVLLLVTCVGVVLSKVKLVNQGYEGVTIAINPDIKENTNILYRLEVSVGGVLECWTQIIIE